MNGLTPPLNTYLANKTVPENWTRVSLNLTLFLVSHTAIRTQQINKK